jgi:hypothetical protein
METLMSILIGVGLSAACGFRVFVPLLIMSAASSAGMLELNPSFEWIGSDAALAAFGVATLLEVAAYYVPVADHLLDIIATPTAVVAGIVATASVVTGMSPLLGWSTAIIAGGGVAAAVQGGTVLTRGASGLATAGLANPLVSTGELAASIAIPVLTILVPGLVVLILACLIFWWLRRRSRRPSSARA